MSEMKPKPKEGTMEEEVRATLERMTKLIDTNARQLGQLMEITQKIIETQQLSMAANQGKS